MTTDILGGERLVQVATPDAVLQGNMTVPALADGMVLFAHGSGSNRHSPRHRYVARQLQSAGFATLLLDNRDRPEPERAGRIAGRGERTGNRAGGQPSL